MVLSPEVPQVADPWCSACHLLTSPLGIPAARISDIKKGTAKVKAEVPWVVSRTMRSGEAASAEWCAMSGASGLAAMCW